MNDRDEFAKAALKGLLAGNDTPDKSWDYVAQAAFKYADAMLAASGVADPPESQHVAETCCTTNHDAEPAATAPSDAMPLPVTHGEGAGEARDDAKENARLRAELEAAIDALDPDMRWHEIVQLRERMIRNLHHAAPSHFLGPPVRIVQPPAAPPGLPDDSDNWRNEAIYSARE